ncbi:unnamed protein product [Linum tenue]|uniref:Barwin domain-containing protein n=1 Tax=Linum tenue TaxID=586396 RepID=A0AAV0HWT3_9ROSI|nr:unnamed protein product [Linum tenue]
MFSCGASHDEDYPRAAFGAGFFGHNFNVTNNCGRCLKVASLLGRREVKVRIVHERNDHGLELDLHSFNRLDNTDGRGDVEGQLTVRYRFESC